MYTSLACNILSCRVGPTHGICLVRLQAKMKSFDAEFRTLQHNASKNVVANGVAGPATPVEAKVLEKARSEGDPSSVRQPAGFAGHLKEYQLKGLQWLVSLYEQVRALLNRPGCLCLLLPLPPHMATWSMSLLFSFFRHPVPGLFLSPSAFHSFATVPLLCHSKVRCCVLVVCPCGSIQYMWFTLPDSMTLPCARLLGDVTTHGSGLSCH